MLNPRLGRGFSLARMDMLCFTLSLSQVSLPASKQQGDVLKFFRTLNRLLDSRAGFHNSSEWKFSISPVTRLPIYHASLLNVSHRQAPHVGQFFQDMIAQFEEAAPAFTFACATATYPQMEWLQLLLTPASLRAN